MGIIQWMKVNLDICNYHGRLSLTHATIWRKRHRDVSWYNFPEVATCPSKLLVTGTYFALFKPREMKSREELKPRSLTWRPSRFIMNTGRSILDQRKAFVSIPFSIKIEYNNISRNVIWKKTIVSVFYTSLAFLFAPSFFCEHGTKVCAKYNFL